jgi:esterase FrsA
VKQGLLDRPCAPLLCVNGVSDSVFPIADHYLLLEHGDAKSARFFPGGHMGHGPGIDVTDTLVAWLSERLVVPVAGAER